jgi:hypothetical protein
MRLAVIADVHGNLIALENVLADIARRRAIGNGREDWAKAFER